MTRVRLGFLTALFLAAISMITNACGGGSRLLRSISVAPATADAHSFPNGQVLFTVSGIYSQPPTPAPLTATGWFVSDATIATISQSGSAQCVPGASGEVTVTAKVPGPCESTNCTSILLSADAKLTCP